MENFIPIKTVSGQINLRNQSSKAFFFHSPTSSSVGNKEVFLDTASKNSITSGIVRKNGSGDYHASVSGGNPKLCGGVTTQTYGIAEGEVIKLHIQVRGGYGSLPKSANVFIRTRKHAAYRRLRFSMSERSNALFTYSEIEGCFDIITLEEALALGVVIPPAFRVFSDPVNVESVLTEDIILKPETEERKSFVEKTVEDGEGNSKVILTRKRKRKIG